MYRLKIFLLLLTAASSNILPCLAQKYDSLERIRSISLLTYSSNSNFPTYTCRIQDSLFIKRVTLQLGGNQTYYLRCDFSNRLNGFGSYMLSFGRYKWRGNRICLTDTFSKYRVSLRKVGNYLTPLKAYPFLRGKVLVSHPSFEDYHFSESSLRHCANQWRDTIADGSNVIYQEHFYSIMHDWRYARIWFWIQFSKSEYTLRLGESVISRGKYTVKGNCLSLVDKNLGATFLFAVSRGGRQLRPINLGTLNPECEFVYVEPF
jgi:hypothetical protein